MVIKRQTYPRVRTGRVMPEAASDEVWRPVVGFETLYEVSSEGRVRSLDRVITQRSRWGIQNRKHPGRILKSKPMQGGYLGLTLCAGGNEYCVHVSHLVAYAFLGPRPDKHQVCHNDGVRTNDRVDNLRYDTTKNNHADKLRHGTAVRGEKCYQAILTSSEVRLIRSLIGVEPQTAIAKRFGVSRSAISSISRGISWSHLQ